MGRVWMSHKCRLCQLAGGARPGARTLPVSGRHGDIGVQAEARHTGAARAGQRIQTLGIDLVSGAGHPLAGVGTKGDSSRDRGRIETREPWLIAPERIRLLRVRLRTQASALEQCGNTLRQGSGQLGDLLIFGSKQGLKLRVILIIGGVDAIQRQE